MMVCSLSLATEARHSFVTVNSINETKNYLAQANKDSLIFIDVDSTLTMPSDPYLRRHAIQNHKKIYNSLVNDLTPNQTRIFKHLMVMESSSQLVEKDWPTIISALQAKGIKILAFTAAKTGPIKSVLSSFPNWRYGELSRLGIDFSPAFPGAILFENLEDFGNDHPGIEKGIVYCGHQLSKGDLIYSVLKAMKFAPSLIILIDDKWENLGAVSKAIHYSFPNMRFIGIHYKAMNHIERPPTDERIFYKKFKSLIEKAKEIAF
ncbi:DUF2608 domain-containing protein [Candidatus Odyssella acanthamoebae]|uniref:DUF2608 domain-containing protein n=1 Tax=Candidatus Odyssella acanthamoebae TaxID=91604 RepID=A0A077AZG0_9PROT|nr:DUF2608 domain-containing protein [Candidatus Paracaedibacter acanthamoebae]AIK97073.1 hypothetical protein ID47_10550 [Candidatus Paracaedibacter acanthamoebae]